LALAKGAGLVYYPYGRVQNADGSITAVPIPGNIVPASMFAADTLIQAPWYPLPNQPVSAPSANYLGSPSTPIDKDQFTARLDFNETAKSAWFARFSWTSEDQNTPTLGGAGAAVVTHGHQYLLSNTRVFSATKVNEVRFGVSELDNTVMQTEPAPVDWVAKMGLPGLNAHLNPISWGMPMTQGLAALSNIGDTTHGPYVANDTTLQGNDNFSWVRGKHSLRFGGELRRDRFNQIGATNTRAYFSFNGYGTSLPSSPQSNVWTGFAEYLLGQPSNVYGVNNLGYAQFRSTSAALYLDDAWHVSPRVTVTLGLRWELVQPWLDRDGNESNVAIPYLPGPNDIGNIANMALHPVVVRTGSGGFYDNTGINYPGVQVARDGRLGNRLQQTNWANFAPRIGLAWSPSDKWAIRVGGGVFYAQDSSNRFFDMNSNVTGSYQLTDSPTMPQFTWTNYLTPGATINIPTPKIYGNDYAARTPRVYQWLADVQRKLSSSTMFVAMYSGSLGRRLEFNYDANQPTPGTTSLASRMPFPEYGVILGTEGNDTSNYNALSTRLQRRAHGITFTGSFTWAHSMDHGSGLQSSDGSWPINSRCISCFYGSSGFDVNRRFVGSIVYDLPFGKGEKFANTGGVVNQIIGGWQISMIYNDNTGLPGTVTNTSDAANVGAAGTEVPDATGLSTKLSNPTPNAWLNAAAYLSQPFGSHFGNEGRASFRKPGTNSGDVILARNFKIREGHSLQFRYEAYNFLNHPNWAPPNATQNSATFNKITLTSVAMRQMQFSLKYRF
jgi:hypothetical protein